MPVFHCVDDRVRSARDQVLVLRLSKEEIIFVENVIISKNVPMTRSLILQPNIPPMRLVALMFMANYLMDLDMDTVVNNFFGGNRQILEMLVDKNC